MEDVYITGHRNPDTDSIVAAISYANLKNSLGDRNYKAIRIGSANDETMRILNRFGFELPEQIKNMRTQISDIDYDHPPCLSSSVTMDRAWKTMHECDITVVPIVHENGTLFGMLSSGDIASYDMQSMTDSSVENLPVFNLVSVLQGTLANGTSFIKDTVSGNIHIALPLSFDDAELKSPHSILICGNQPEIIDAALESQVACIIICQADIKSGWTEGHENTCIISTPFDARMASRLIYQAKPVSSVCKLNNPISFHLSDYVDDVRDLMLKNRYRAYPVLDGQDKVVGTISRYHLLRPRRKKVILVDHNEASQSVSGLEQVDLIEIIDHHRIADIQTRQPIYVRNEPVGSTNTIIASMYQEYGVTPSPSLAGLMCAAILSDTVLFKSPTCTKRDIAMAERLARIAQISVDELGKCIFSSDAADSKTARELLKTDLKQFIIQDHNIAVSQITCAGSEHIIARKQELFDEMEILKRDDRYDLFILMITDVLQEGTRMMFLGKEEIIKEAFSCHPVNNEVFLPKVMSRKKQIIPLLSALWS